MITMEEILTAQEVATELKTSVETVKRLLRKHEMPGFKVGIEWRVNRSELEEWKKLNRNRYQPPAQEN